MQLGLWVMEISFWYHLGLSYLFIYSFIGKGSSPHSAVFREQGVTSGNSKLYSMMALYSVLVMQFLLR